MPPSNESFNDLKHRVSYLESLTTPPVVKFKKLHADAVVPQYMTDGAAGMDVFLHTEDVVMMPEAVVLIKIGLAVELPRGYEIQVRPRSGMALKYNITVLNSPGTIDEDYRGEIGVLLINHGELHTLHKGERIAQLVIARVERPVIEVVTELSETARGAGGTGSTGA